MFKLNKRIITILLSVMVLSTFLFMAFSASGSSQTATSYSYNGTAPKYVFMFIGDGMSFAQINSAEAYLGKAYYEDKKVDVRRLNFSNFPVAGACTTFDATSFCPDSASTATSLSTGYKTHSGTINMDVTKQVKYKTITEMVKEKGYKVGVISSVSIDHATPAAYYAHQPSRSNYYDIALEMANSNFDFFGGGGLLQPKGKAGDQADVLELATKNGFKVVTNKDEILGLNNTSGRVIAMNSVLDSSKALPYEIDREKSDLSLADFTRKGIEVLNNPKGFFLMVEGGKIDWACHANDAGTTIHETLAFEKAVNEAIEFYNQHQSETLIIVTGDHETGGLSIGFAGTGYSTYFDKISHQNKSYAEFDSVIKEYVSKTSKDNAKLEDLLPDIKAAFGLITSKDKDAEIMSDMVLTEYETQRLRAALAQSIVPKSDRKYTDEEKVLYGGYEPLSVTLTHILNNKAGIAWTSYSHTGVPLPVFAKGKGESLFVGYYDNTDVFKKLSSILKLN